MDWLLEKPLVIVLLGLTTAGLCGFLWTQTGRQGALYALLGVLAVTGGLLLVERLVETDREQIDAILHQAAREVERNEIESLMRFTHSRAERMRRQARDELPRYDFDQVSIKSNLVITVRQDRDPLTATARFNAVVSASERDGLIKNQRVARYVVVRFEKEGNAWRATDYEHHDPRQGLLRRRR